LTVLNLIVLLTARREFSSNDLMALNNAMEFAAGVVLTALSVRMAYSQWRDLHVRHQLYLKLPDAL